MVALSETEDEVKELLLTNETKGKTSFTLKKIQGIVGQLVKTGKPASKSHRTKTMHGKKNILLVEPGYPNKYPPLGLMKLAAYHGPHGRGDNVVFVKGPNHRTLEERWDRVYVTTLFSFEWKRPLLQSISPSGQPQGNRRGFSSVASLHP